VTGDGERGVRFLLLSLLLLVPLLPNPGLFTNYDSPKWALLAAGMLAVTGILAVRALRSNEPVKVGLPTQISLLSLLAIAGMLWAKRAPDARLTVLAWAQVGTLSAYAVAASRYFKEPVWATRTFVVAAVAGAAASVVGLAGALGLPWGTASTFGNPSFAAEFVAPALILALALALLGRWKLALATGVPMVLFLVVAKSRADWLGFAAGLGVLCLVALFGWLKRHPPARLLTAVLLVLVMALPWVTELVPLPALGRGDTVAIRGHIRRSTLEMAADHPVTGVGLEGFRAAYPAYRDPAEVRLSLRREVTFPHNLPLSVAAETGVPGFLFLLLFAFVTVSAGIRTIWAHPDEGIAFGGVGAVVAILVSAQLSAPLRHPGSALLFFLLAALLVARSPRRFVTNLKGRYRRFLPVGILAAPVLVGAVLLGPRLLADFHLHAAVKREVDLAGGMDAEVVENLRRSVARAPLPDALRQLAFFRNANGEPERANSVLDDLFSVSPRDETGRLERARAFILLGRPLEAVPIIEGLRPGREDFDILHAMEGEARFHAALVAPPEEIPRHVKVIDARYPTRVLALIRAAERIGGEDPDRGIRILAEIDSPEAYYYAAIILAADGKLDKAMIALTGAIQLGAADKERLENDPRLDPLRGRSDFKKLVERL